MDHEESVVLEAKDVALPDELQGLQEAHSDDLALAREHILDDSDRLDVLVGLEVRVDQDVQQLHLQVTVLDLVEHQEVLVIVNQLLVLRLLRQTQDLVQVAALKCALNQQHV